MPTLPVARRNVQRWLEQTGNAPLQEYIDAAKAASARVAQLSDHLMQALPEWSLAPVVDSLIALRGVDKLAAIVLLAELGDISRFNSPRELMAFLGLVPPTGGYGSSLVCEGSEEETGAFTAPDCYPSPLI